MYPGLALLLFCCLYRPSTPLWKCFSGFAVLHFTTPPMCCTITIRRIMTARLPSFCWYLPECCAACIISIRSSGNIMFTMKQGLPPMRRRRPQQAAELPGILLPQDLPQDSDKDFENIFSLPGAHSFRRESISRNRICACCWQSVFCTVALPSMILETAKLRQQLMICRENYRPSSWNSRRCAACDYGQLSGSLAPATFWDGCQK